jgi:hypothetical protein
MSFAKTNEILENFERQILFCFDAFIQIIRKIIINQIEGLPWFTRILHENKQTGKFSIYWDKSSFQIMQSEFVPAQRRNFE